MLKLPILKRSFEARPARGATMCPLIEELRTKKANLRRAALRKVQSTTLADLPEVEGYRAAVADLSATLMGSNVEAARTALRGLVGSVSVFAEGGKLYGRIGLDAAQLLRSSNPEFIESCGSGGPLWSHSRGVVCFTDALEVLRNALPTELSVPDACGKGHPLTSENLQMHDREGRWRCRQCGRERAAAFRARQRTEA
jgi:hypothetical protein